MSALQEQYHQLLQHPKWRLKRVQILSRDNYTCQNCGAKYHLIVHHKQYHTDTVSGKKIAPWAYQNKYLVTLCDTCHKAGHQRYQIPFFHI
ncbi:MAG: HNH endonuclease [Bacteroidetes bacterium]|nr:HNH endonuclease [Bacteroidota bacterium]